MRQRGLHGRHRDDRANVRWGGNVPLRFEQGVRTVRLQGNDMLHAMQWKQRLRRRLPHVCGFLL
jgi:hypothetical protein